MHACMYMTAPPANEIYHILSNPQQRTDGTITCGKGHKHHLKLATASTGLAQARVLGGHHPNPPPSRSKHTVAGYTCDVTKCHGTTCRRLIATTGLWSGAHDEGVDHGAVPAALSHEVHGHTDVVVGHNDATELKVGDLIYGQNADVTAFPGGVPSCLHTYEITRKHPMHQQGGKERKQYHNQCSVHVRTFSSPRNAS
jgi:hypothetical protein